MPSAMLDTSCCVEILRGRPPPEAWRGLQFRLSAVAEAELWAGVYHAGGRKERLKLEKLLSSVEIVPFERKAAEACGKVLAALARKGLRIGDFDAQIAGHALATRSSLATLNVKHFERVDGLELLPWVAPPRRRGE